MFKKKIILIFISFFILQGNSFSSEKIAYMDFNYIINNSIIGKKVLNDLNNLNKKNIENLKNEQKKLQKEAEEINKIKNIANSEDIKKKIEIHNQNIKKYENLKKTLSDNLNKKRNEEMKKIVQLINPLLENYMKNNLIDIILSKEVVFFSKEKYDISQKILELTNQTYK
tara:strand:- start:2242 stop:2751 length:510 start_codon:yes stop_codon:yes gene_type:complete